MLHEMNLLRKLVIFDKEKSLGFETEVKNEQAAMAQDNYGRPPFRKIFAFLTKIYVHFCSR